MVHVAVSHDLKGELMYKFMLIPAMLLMSLGLVFTVSATTPSGPVEGRPAIVLDPVMQLKDSDEPKTETTRSTYVKELVESIKAIEDKGLNLTDARRLKIAEAALYAEEQTGVDAVFMLALARMESDFRGLIMLNTHCQHGLRTYNCFADCGMTQHHVRGDLDYVRRFCKRLSRDPKLSFLNSAKEIAHHVRWCSDPKRAHLHQPLRRCVLNRYNQGPFYGRKEQCERQNRCYLMRKGQFSSDNSYELNLKDCYARRRKCMARAAYWKKLTCFEYGARNKVSSLRSCRGCHKLSYIATFYYPVPDQKTAFDALLASFLR